MTAKPRTSRAVSVEPRSPATVEKRTNTGVRLPASERMVLSVSLAYWPHEDSSGLPTQIVMQAPRKTLMGFLMSGADKSALEQQIQVREY